MGKVTDRAEALLTAKGVDFSKTVSGDWTSLVLKPAPNSEFSFFFEDYSDGNANLGAKRIGSDSEEYFFRIPYEPIDFESPKALEDKAIEQLELLISHSVRIRRSRGWLLENWSAEVIVGSEIKVIDGASGFRWGFKFPPMNGSEQVFEGQALAARRDG